MAGMVRGKLTLLQATAITDRWGTTHYGRLSGVLAAGSVPREMSPVAAQPPFESKDSSRKALRISVKGWRSRV